MAPAGGTSLTIRDAARATGLSAKALQRRIERGTLSAELVDGVRRMGIAELVRAGLLVTRADAGPPRTATTPDPRALEQRVAALEARVAALEGRLR